MKFIEVLQFTPESSTAIDKWSTTHYSRPGAYLWPDGDLVLVYGEASALLVTLISEPFVEGLLQLRYDREEPNIDVHRFLDQLIKLQNPPTREI